MPDIFNLNRQVDIVKVTRPVRHLQVFYVCTTVSNRLGELTQRTDLVVHNNP